MAESLEIGVQFHLPTHGSTRVTQLQELTRSCADGGVSQVWITDNLGSRNLFVVLAALSAVPVKLGAAVMVQYFRGPLEAAGALATISELMDGRELSLGLGRGNPTTPSLIETPRAISFMRETAECLAALFSGASVTPTEYPLLAEYFRMQPDASLALRFRPAGPIRIYGGGNGPLGLKVARSSMDGIIFGGTMLLPLLKLGRLAEALGDKVNDSGAVARRIAGVKISVHDDPTVARDFVRGSVGARMTGLRQGGLPDEDFQALGIDPARVDALLQARLSGGDRPTLAAMVDDAMIDAMFIAGDPDECRSKLAAIQDEVVTLGFDQMMFSELGPEPVDAISLLLTQVISTS